MRFKAGQSAVDSPEDYALKRFRSI